MSSSDSDSEFINFRKKGMKMKPTKVQSIFKSKRSQFSKIYESDSNKGVLKFSHNKRKIKKQSIYWGDSSDESDEDHIVNNVVANNVVANNVGANNVVANEVVDNDEGKKNNLIGKMGNKIASMFGAYIDYMRPPDKQENKKNDAKSGDNNHKDQAHVKQEEKKSGDNNHKDQAHVKQEDKKSVAKDAPVEDVDIVNDPKNAPDSNKNQENDHFVAKSLSSKSARFEYNANRKTIYITPLNDDIVIVRDVKINDLSESTKKQVGKHLIEEYKKQISRSITKPEFSLLNVGFIKPTKWVDLVFNDDKDFAKKMKELKEKVNTYYKTIKKDFGL